MKVSELIEKLNKCDPNDLVVMSKDSEGNSYSPLTNLSKMIYVPETKYYGAVYIRKLTKSLSKEGYRKGDLYDGDDGVNCVVVWP